jgi:nucleotide-binding universal stress UspA family protein
VRDWEPVVVKEIQRRLESMAVPARAAGVETSTAVLVGIPFIELIRAVLRNQHDILIKDLVHDEGAMTPAIGSTDMHLLRKCPSPVWLVKQTSSGRFTRALAAVDPEPGDDVRNALNAKVLELATSLARSEGCELHVVRAWDAMGEEFCAGESGADEYEKYMERIRTVRVKTATEFIGRFQSGCDQFDVRHVMGTPEVVIPSIAEQENVDLVIMGTIARTGIAGLLIGRTAEAVFRQVRCSVLAVKPEGFVSPVTL